MSECTQLSERMAAVAHGRNEWSATEKAHLASCADCTAEWRVMQAGAMIGAEVAATLPVDFVATRVVATLKIPAGSRGWWARLRWFALPVAAAAAVALVVFPRGGPASPGGTTTEVVEVSVLPELESLEASDLELVLELLPDRAAPVEIRSFEELTDDEVTRLINSLEG